MSTFREEDCADQLGRLHGKMIVKAVSSLDQFRLELEDSLALAVQARQEKGVAAVNIAMLNSINLPALQDAVCSVDWSWIHGSKIETIVVLPTSIRFVLQPAGPLTVSAAFWNGSPFLAFQPFQAPKRDSSSQSY